MRCNKCTDSPKAIDDVQGCKTCRDDGTANEIPKHLEAGTPLEAAVELKPGLGNRFIPERPAPAEEPAAEAKTPARSKKPR